MENKVRKRKVTVRFTEEEMTRIDAICEKLDLDYSKLIRKALQKTKVIKRS